MLTVKHTMCGVLELERGLWCNCIPSPHHNQW